MHLQDLVHRRRGRDIAHKQFTITRDWRCGAAHCTVVQLRRVKHGLGLRGFETRDGKAFIGGRKVPESDTAVGAGGDKVGHVALGDAANQCAHTVLLVCASCMGKMDWESKV